MLAIHRQALQTEVQYLQSQVAKPKSIWEMRKPDLVEVACAEMSMTRMQAEKRTVIELRELIRRHRAQVAQTLVEQNPLAQMPKGLAKMKADQLKEVMTQRGLAIPENPTRPAMILAIREHVEANQWLLNVDPHELPQEEWEDLAGMEVDAQEQSQSASSQNNPNPIIAPKAKALTPRRGKSMTPR